MGKEESRISPLLKQLWTISGVLLCMLAEGMVQGFTSVLLTALRKPDSSIKIDIHLASWLASGMAISIAIGTLTATIFMEIFGRKVAFILELIPGLISLFLVYFATDFSTLMIARILDGITGAGTILLGAVIIGEYASPAYRGMFLNLKTACICFGTTLVHYLGYFMHWKTVTTIIFIPYAIGLTILFTWRESPAWLAYKKKYKKAEEAFIWLRGDSEETRAELSYLIMSQKGRVACQLKSSFASRIKRFFTQVQKKDFLQPVFILVCSLTLLETSGRHIVPSYIVDIVGGLGSKHGQTLYYTLAIDLIITISATFSSVLIKLMKTRTLLLCSGISSLLVLGSVCFYLFLASQDIISKDRPLVPLSMFIVYFVLVNLGCTPIPLSLMGELLPMEHKAYGAFVMSVIGCIIILIILKVFPYMMLYLQIYGAFAILGLVSATMLIILYFTLPETKHRTLQEIEDCMKYGKVLNKGKTEESTKMLHPDI